MQISVIDFNETGENINQNSNIRKPKYEVMRN